MNRRGFLSQFLIGSAAIISAPQIVFGLNLKVPKREIIPIRDITFKNIRWVKVNHKGLLVPASFHEALGELLIHKDKSWSIDITKTMFNGNSVVENSLLMSC